MAKKNSLYNMGGKCYANGSTVIPNMMQPGQQMPYQFEEYAQNENSDFGATKIAAKAGLNPQVLAATGGWSALAPVAGLAVDAFNWKRNQGERADIRENNAQYKSKYLNLTSPYGNEGYSQNYFSEGGGINNRRNYPGWKPYGSNPSLFQMSENNNNSPGYSHGGGVDDDYGTIPGQGSPVADDKKMIAENNAYVVPNDKIHIAKGILHMMGYDPEKKMPTMAPGAQSPHGGQPINISSKEMYLSPEMKSKMKLFTGMDERQFEKTLSPNSEHNQHYASGGPLDNFSDWWYNNMRSDDYRQNNYSKTQSDHFNDDLSPEDTFTPREQMNAENEASKNFDYSVYNPYNSPLQQPPVTGEPESPAPAAPTPTSTATDDMADQYKNANRNLFIANTVVGAGKGIYNLMQKYNDIPRPQQYQPEQFDANFSAMESSMNRQVQKSGATARYNARNYAQTAATNSAINANEIDAKLNIASRMGDAKNQQSYKNTEMRNQASLYNLGMNTQWQQNNSIANQQFRQNKANALSGNIDQLLKGYQNYTNANLGINAMEKGYNMGNKDQQLLNKMQTNPRSLTQEDIDRINMLTGGNLTLEALQNIK